MNWKTWSIAGIVAATLGIFVVANTTTFEDTRLSPAVRIDIVDDNGKVLGHGSGTHIGGGRILTAAHVAEPAFRLIVVDERGVVYAHNSVIMSSDEKADVALLYNPLVAPSLRPARLVCNYVYRDLEEVYVNGNPMNETNYRRRGQTAQAPRQRFVWQNTMLVDMTGAPGDSGSGVFRYRMGSLSDLIGIVVHGYRVPFPLRSPMGVVPSNTACEALNIDG